jgi:hypothetical protein
MSAAAKWKIVGPQQATLHCGGLEALVQCRADGTRLVPTKWQGQTVQEVVVLKSAASSELQLADFYVRGADLVADFFSAGPERIAPQIYWRADIEGTTSAVRVELILSVRTELLDSGPVWSVDSCVPGAELLHASDLTPAAFNEATVQGSIVNALDSKEHLFVFRQPEQKFSYAEMVHPSDFVSAEVSRTKPATIKSTLFPERLEKGVIRRGRVCGWFLPSEDDLAMAVQFAKRFVDEPLPLTA